jgi:DNA-binding MarR family transcriptional regulator
VSGDQDGGDGWPPAALADRLAFLLKHAQLRMTELAEPGLTALGIDGREFGVLALFSADGPLSQQQAAQRLVIDRTTMVALVDGLERKGLVERRPHPSDRRKNTVALTAQGTTTFERGARAVADAEDRFLDLLTPVAARDLRAALQTLISGGP